MLCVTGLADGQYISLSFLARIITTFPEIGHLRKINKIVKEKHTSHHKISFHQNYFRYLIILEAFNHWSLYLVAFLSGPLSCKHKVDEAQLSGALFCKHFLKRQLSFVITALLHWPTANCSPFLQKIFRRWTRPNCLGLPVKRWSSTASLSLIEMQNR